MLLYTIAKSMHAFWLVNQLWFILPVNPWKNLICKSLACGSWFTYSSLVLPTSRVVYQPINHRNLWSIAWIICKKNKTLCQQNFPRIQYASCRKKWFICFTRLCWILAQKLRIYKDSSRCSIDTYSYDITTEVMFNCLCCCHVCYCVT